MGARLVEERERLGLSQQQFFRACGISKAQQYNFEKGINYPGGAYLIAADALGVDVLYVLTGKRAALLNRKEEALLDNYRHASDGGKSALDETGVVTAQSGTSVKRKRSG